MSGDSLIPPPEPFTNNVVHCPSCGHGIDPHGTDPGSACGVGVLVEISSSGQWCKRHECHQDAPLHPYNAACEYYMRDATPEEEAALGKLNVPCQCMWQPNDIAAYWMAFLGDVRTLLNEYDDHPGTVFPTERLRKILHHAQSQGKAQGSADPGADH